MNTNPVLWLQAYIIGVLVFLISITARTSIRSGLIRKLPAYAVFT